MNIIQIIYGEEMSYAKLGENGVIGIVETSATAGIAAHYDVARTDGTFEKIFDVKRVLYREP